MIFKCKICGGSLEIQPGNSVCVCEYCGTKQTLPNLEDEWRVSLYDRANHFRRNNDFDKAIGVYETILEKDRTDAEAYWSLLLCKYGIEYVEDPKTNKRVPTCNRTQFTSIYADADYKAAIQYADAGRRELYEAEAEVIEGIQKEILTISQKEEPFDVFICYKETDAGGNRTPDSVLAQELYYELTELGYRVFFSRITLEGKPGTAYEPYIFAALNSAKVMVVVGTKAEYLNAVWVRNEWSRYLSLIKKGERKVLIPAYRDMDPYDMPEEFSLLQAQDMAKLGFMQDLVRGIQKIVVYEKERPVEKPVHEKPPIPAEQPKVEKVPVNVEALLERAYISLEDSEWGKAEELLEQVLNQEPKNVPAYIGKLMIEQRVHNEEELAHSKTPFSSSPNYLKIQRFADEATRNRIQSYHDGIVRRRQKEWKESTYKNACNDMASGDEYLISRAVESFRSLGVYEDAVENMYACMEKLKEFEEVKKAQKKQEEKDTGKKALLVALMIIILFFAIIGFLDFYL